MIELANNIPSYYSNTAEILSCLVYIFLFEKRQSKIKIIGVTAVIYLLESFLIRIDDQMPIYLWPLIMTTYVVLMFFCLWFAVKKPWKDIVYLTLKAFLVAEFIASFEWQLASFYGWTRLESEVLKFSIAVVFYILLLVVFYFIERKAFEDVKNGSISFQELMLAFIIVLVVFALSNIGFVAKSTPFSGSGQGDTFIFRTLFDLAGIAIMFLFQSRLNELESKSDLQAMTHALKDQYNRYKNYQDSIELIHMKYHDLKHQIEDLKESVSDENQRLLLSNIESELLEYTPTYHTGNSVLDALLDSRMSICRKRGITITAVADGKQLDFISVADICTIIGNALDNSIESVFMFEEEERRLIHLEISERKNFVCICMENPCEEGISFEDGMPVTRKKDKDNHGYGVRSIVKTVQKYNGSTLFDVKNNWFTLRILIPK